MTAINDLLYQLKITEQKLTHLFEKQLHISLTRYQILETLLQESPCSQRQLQESLQIDQAAITRHLSQLEKEGYIQRQRNPLNQREMLVQLTEKTQNALVTAPSQEHLRIKREMEEILSQDEAHHLQLLLEKMMHGLESITITE